MMNRKNAKSLLMGMALGTLPMLLPVLGGFFVAETADAQSPRPGVHRRAPVDPVLPFPEKEKADAAKRAKLNPMNPGPVKPGQEGMTGDVSPEAVEAAKRAKLNPMNPGPVKPGQEGMTGDVSPEAVEAAKRAKLNPMNPGPVKPGQEGMIGDVSPEAVEAAKADAKDARPGRPGGGPMRDFKRPFPGANAQWQRGFTRDWIAAEKERHEIKPHADNKAIAVISGSQKDGATYGNYTEKDLLLWEKETERLVVEGSLIFHSADLLGSQNGVSCDMCHPDGEGTHAETYPKYQVQLGRAALLRDMANWCLENPCRAEPMSGDDPRMRAMEAYMQAQRTGKPMKYGKH